MTLASCPACGAAGPEPILSVRGVPVICNQLWPDAASARAAPAGDIELVLCPRCALVWNRAFDPGRMHYAPGYENALHFSPRFRAFAEELAADLVARHQLRGGHVVEVGCGDGYMLDLIVRHGAATATGFDPSMAGRRPDAASPGVEIVPEYFSAEHLDRPVDAVLCRHVLEHLDAPLPFLRSLRCPGDDRPVPVYLEVPNAGWLFDRVSIWDVIYEHVTYWTAGSIEALLRRAGFRPVRIATGYGDQFLMAEGVPDDAAAGLPADALEPALAAARAFGRSAEVEIEAWRQRVAALSGRAVIWGAGSKGICFANLLGGAGGSLVALVDKNPRKHGMRIPGVALPVVGPQELARLRPELVLIANALYQKEVTAELRGCGVRSDLEVLVG